MIRKIVVINSKGGCGKTTLSTNLASFYAANGCPSALFDYDPQDSATRWLSQRPDYHPKATSPDPSRCACLRKRNASSWILRHP